MYASNSALLNALAQQKIDFKQVLNFIDARYDFTPTAFLNGHQKNAANENQGSCKVFSFAQLNHLNQLDTLALFAEHYHTVRDNPAGTDHQNIRQFIHNGWQGIHFEGEALHPKANIDEINRKMAQAYTAGSSEFTPIQQVEDPQPTENQPGAVPTPNPPSDELVENSQNLTEASDVKDADGSIDTHAQESVPAVDQVVNTVADTTAVVDSAPVEVAPVDTTATKVTPTDTAVETAAIVAETKDSANNSSAETSTHAHQDFDEKAEQAIAEAEAANSAERMIPPAPGSSNTMNNETTYLHDNDSVTAGTATTDIEAQEPEKALENSTNTSVDHQPVTTTQSSGSGMSASELVEANAVHIADNPAAFIEEDNTSTNESEPATTPSEQSALASTSELASESKLASEPKLEPVSKPPTDNITTNQQPEATVKDSDTSHHSTLANTSASELVHANANHVANNPAAFIEEKNTDTDSSEPATDVGTESIVNSVDSAASPAIAEQVTTPTTATGDTHSGTDSSTHENTLASASASELVHANANHVADNPAAFIEEKNTDTDSSEPATDTIAESDQQAAEVQKPHTP